MEFTFFFFLLRVYQASLVPCSVEKSGRALLCRDSAGNNCGKSDHQIMVPPQKSDTRGSPEKLQKKYVEMNDVDLPKPWEEHPKDGDDLDSYFILFQVGCHCHHGYHGDQSFPRRRSTVGLAGTRRRSRGACANEG